MRGPGPEILLLLLGALIGLFVASALLRAAVALANRAIGPVVRKSSTIDWDWDAEDDDDDYIDSAKLAMPEPGLGQGMMIVFLVALVNTVATLLITGLFEVDRRLEGDELPGWIAAHLLGMVTGFVTLMGLLASMLPTRPKWAALGAFFFYLIIIFLTALVVGLGYLVFAGR